MGFDLAVYIAKQQVWSRKAFGPGPRTGGLSKHIMKELAEIQEEPFDVTEWVDIVILALDGAWRAGYSPEAIVEALIEKQKVNIGRQWPKPKSQNEPIEHIREDVLGMFTKSVTTQIRELKIKNPKEQISATIFMSQDTVDALEQTFSNRDIVGGGGSPPPITEFKPFGYPWKIDSIVPFGTGDVRIDT